MAYREHRPRNELARRIECYWTRTDDGVDETTRVLPDGCIDVIFDLERGSWRVVGVMTEAVVVERASASGPRDEPSAVSTTMLGVRFRPGEALGWLAFAAHESKDATIPLRDVWGRAAGRRGPSRARGSADARSATRRARPRPRRAFTNATTRPARRSRRRRDRGSVWKHRGRRGRALWSDSDGRQLERAFDTWVGLGPKAFARVVRLRTLVGLLPAIRRWADVAAHLGYADQAHLIRDVRKLAGVTPLELARERTRTARDVGNVQSFDAAST